jgi:hypothetical protein
MCLTRRLTSHSAAQSISASCVDVPSTKRIRKKVYARRDSSNERSLGVKRLSSLRTLEFFGQRFSQPIALACALRPIGIPAGKIFS